MMSPRKTIQYENLVIFTIKAFLTTLWSRQWHLTPVLLPGKPHGQRSLESCGPWCRWGSDTTEWLHFHFSLSCIEEGNGNPLQCSWLENSRDGGAWWAAIYGVTQSQTWLKWLSSSNIHSTIYTLMHLYIFLSARYISISARLGRQLSKHIN